MRLWLWVQWLCLLLVWVDSHLRWVVLLTDRLRLQRGCIAKYSKDLCRLVEQWRAIGTWSWTVISVKYLDFRQMLESSQVKMNVRVWTFGGLLENRWSSWLESLVFCTVDIGIEFDWREGVDIYCVVEVLHWLRYETLALSSMTLFTIGLSRFPLNLSCSSH